MAYFVSTIRYSRKSTGIKNNKYAFLNDPNQAWSSSRTDMYAGSIVQIKKKTKHTLKVVHSRTQRVGREKKRFEINRIPPRPHKSDFNYLHQRKKTKKKPRYDDDDRRIFILHIRITNLRVRCFITPLSFLLCYIFFSN